MKPATTLSAIVIPEWEYVDKTFMYIVKNIIFVVQNNLQLLYVTSTNIQNELETTTDNENKKILNLKARILLTSLCLTAIQFEAANCSFFSAGTARSRYHQPNYMKLSFLTLAAIHYHYSLPFLTKAFKDPAFVTDLFMTDLEQYPVLQPLIGKLFYYSADTAVLIPALNIGAPLLKKHNPNEWIYLLNTMKQKPWIMGIEKSDDPAVSDTLAPAGTWLHYAIRARWGFDDINYLMSDPEPLEPFAVDIQGLMPLQYVNSINYINEFPYIFSKFISFLKKEHSFDIKFACFSHFQEINAEKNKALLTAETQEVMDEIFHDFFKLFLPEEFWDSNEKSGQQILFFFHLFLDFITNSLYTFAIDSLKINEQLFNSLHLSNFKSPEKINKDCVSALIHLFMDKNIQDTERTQLANFLLKKLSPKYIRSEIADSDSTQTTAEEATWRRKHLEWHWVHFAIAFADEILFHTLEERDAILSSPDYPYRKDLELLTFAKARSKKIVDPDKKQRMNAILTTLLPKTPLISRVSRTTSRPLPTYSIFSEARSRYWDLNSPAPSLHSPVLLPESESESESESEKTSRAHITRSGPPRFSLPSSPHPIPPKKIPEQNSKINHST